MMRCIHFTTGLSLFLFLFLDFHFSIATQGRILCFVSLPESVLNNLAIDQMCFSVNFGSIGRLINSLEAFAALGEAAGSQYAGKPKMTPVSTPCFHSDRRVSPLSTA